MAVQCGQLVIRQSSTGRVILRLFLIYPTSSTLFYTTTTMPDQHLLSIGKQCSLPTCLLVDFLPFKCQHCEHSFCQEHFLVSAHNCPDYDESKYNRIAPSCMCFHFMGVHLLTLPTGPLCNTPVAVRPGQDPNVRMEEHFTKDCSVITGKSGKARTMPVCARGGCKKVLFSPIRCDVCCWHLSMESQLNDNDHRNAKTSSAPRIDFLPTIVVLPQLRPSPSLSHRSFCLT